MNFYKLEIDIGRKKKFAYGIGINNKLWEEVICPACMRTWKKDIMLNEDSNYNIILSNNNFCDFLSYGTLTLISANALEAFKQEKVIGYHVGKINIVLSNELSENTKKQLKRDGYKVDNFASKPGIYFRLLVEGKAELHQNSEIALVESCNVCGFSKYRPIRKPISLEDHFPRLILKKDSWDGSDLFRVKEYDTVIFCTQNFLNVYEKNKLTGLIFNEVTINS